MGDFNTVQIVSGVLALVVLGIIILRRRNQDTDPF